MNGISLGGLACLLLCSAVHAAVWPHLRSQLSGPKASVRKDGSTVLSYVHEDGEFEKTLTPSAFREIDDMKRNYDEWGYPPYDNVQTPHDDSLGSQLDESSNERYGISVLNPDDTYDNAVTIRVKREPTEPTSSSTTESTTTLKSPAPPQDAVVQTRPDLVHPAFTTYFFSVTIPCVIAWVFVTWLCLWICRPHSPLYREILKRLIEHSQMKQKSVLFAATVLAGERKPPEDPNAEAASAK